MLFAHIADTHLGYRQFNLEERELDFYRAWHEAVELMIAEGVELVVHSGDLFDEPRPPIRALVEAKKGIKRLLEKGVRVVMIPGNHDMIMRRGSMAPHAIFDGVSVLTMENPSVVVDDVFIGGVPYLPRSYRAVLLENMAGLEKEAAQYKRRLLMLHQGVDKYLPFGHELSAGELPMGFDYLALGHVHSRIEEDVKGTRVCYPGSTEIWRIEEAGDWEREGKGFLLVDTDDMEPRRMSLGGVRPFVRTEVASEEDVDALKKALEGLGHKRPVASVTIQSEKGFSVLYDRLKREVSGMTLHLAVKRGLFKVEEARPRTPVLDIRELIYDAAEGLDEAEKAFAYDLFRSLSRGDGDGAVSLAEDFYGRWKEGALR